MKPGTWRSLYLMPASTASAAFGFAPSVASLPASPFSASEASTQPVVRADGSLTIGESGVVGSGVVR